MVRTEKEGQTLTLNVVSIFIGVLIVRVLVAWFEAFRYFIEYKVNSDIDQALIDQYHCSCCAIGSIIVTAIAGLFIIVTFSWYRDHK